MEPVSSPQTVNIYSSFVAKRSKSLHRAELASTLKSVRSDCFRISETATCVQGLKCPSHNAWTRHLKALPTLTGYTIRSGIRAKNFADSYLGSDMRPGCLPRHPAGFSLPRTVSQSLLLKDGCPTPVHGVVKLNTLPHSPTAPWVSRARTFQ